ncbi:MAG: DUF1329 domain-containing protein [Deltaproteobacteria bacterium]|nr:DUF1329 domain-containing protein [Deltaproteobacteria bacterium]
MRVRALVLASLLALPQSALAQEKQAVDVLPTTPFKEGDTISFEQVEKLKEFLPSEFWTNREFFFYEGMQLEIGPTLRKYGAADAYIAMSEKYKGQATIGEDGGLVNYGAGQPFEAARIDCKGDPNAGVKIIWNFVKAWNGDGARSTWSYTYWDRGEQLPLYYEGTAKVITLVNRVEPEYQTANAGDVFPNEKRNSVFGIEVDAPFDARGIMLLTYRYRTADGPLKQAKNDDTWVYVPDLRRVRRISSAQRTDSVQGTDFTMDDLRSFAGIPPQYEWKCVGEQTVIAPMNTKSLAYPYADSYNFGPYGFSFASDRWEVRNAWIIRFDPRNEDHPYHHKDIYVDKETYEPLYSFAYDRKKELWKIIWHNHRYSSDWDGVKNKDPKAADGVWYPGWEGVPDPKDNRIISDIIVNVQTGTGNRIEFWNSEGSPFNSKGKIRRYIDIGRLNKGR